LKKLDIFSEIGVL